MLLGWLPWFVAVSLVVFYAYGMYHRIWHYARVRDLVAIVGAVSLSVAIVFVLDIFIGTRIPRSIYVLSWMLSIGSVGMSRLAFKINWDNLSDGLDGGVQKKQVLIVGAGDAGAMMVREIEQNDAATMNIVGFIDDDVRKQGSRLSGFPVLGTTDDIVAVSKEKCVDEIIIAMPSVSGSVIRKLADTCRLTGCQVKIMPSLLEMTDEHINVRKLRDINIEDLLRRDPIHLDFEKITGYIAGKTVLITGAGGSIGSEISRQISRVGAKEIILLGRGENSIYEIYQELKVKFPDQLYRTVIANITDARRMEEVFAKYRPQVVFHAAAHKHVPLMEIQPVEAVRNNVFGTKNVAELADRFSSEIFVLISTDKAVNPTSVMGATKRCAELVLQEINQHSSTKFVTVRFGNVLGSRGSVVPLFEKQIAAGGPVTITHPEMTRFFMTIPEAVQLVLQAGSQAEGGEVFLFDMGKPVKIKDMAYDLIQLHGLQPDKDIKLVYTGLRPGEKLYEELLTSEEGTSSTRHEKIFKARINPLDADELSRDLQILADSRDAMVILQTIKRMIPTYKSRQLEEAVS
ncbi:MAG: polysaccharide biosynthesis protein, partial [Selenomonadaceae bacterium]|nr:polysaccharide biosynthesis protein [Selenomonadaceae bacterium]